MYIFLLFFLLVVTIRGSSIAKGKGNRLPINYSKYKSYMAETSLSF